MKKITILFLFLLSAWTSVLANNSSIETFGTFDDLNPMAQSISEQMHSTDFKLNPMAEYSCTLKAELSYKGVSVKVSITADTCTEAGAGLADVTTAFYFRVLQMANN